MSRLTCLRFRLKHNTSRQYLVAQYLQLLQYQFPRSNVEHSVVTYINTLLFGFVDIVSLLAFQANLPNSQIISNNKNNTRISKMFIFPSMKFGVGWGWVMCWLILAANIFHVAQCLQMPVSEYGHILGKRQTHSLPAPSSPSIDTNLHPWFIILIHLQCPGLGISATADSRRLSQVTL